MACLCFDCVSLLCLETFERKAKEGRLRFVALEISLNVLMSFVKFFIQFNYFANEYLQIIVYLRNIINVYSLLSYK